VRPLLVVDLAEGIELGLELGDGPRARLLPEPALQGLVEALDLALRLGMAGCPVLLLDAEIGEQVLEGVVPAGEARGVDRAVVGERGRGEAVRLARGAERGHHVVARDPTEGRAVEQVAGVVVEPRADLDLRAVGEPPVGHVRLPQLVGCRGLEAEPRTARALVRLGHHEARGMEDPSDRRGRGRTEAFPLEVPGDRQRAGIEPLCRELGAQSRDTLTDLVGCPARAGVRSAGARLEVLHAAFAVPAQESVQMLATDAALGRGGGDGQSPGDDLQDGDPMLRHASDCRRCPDSPVAYQVSPMS